MKPVLWDGETQLTGDSIIIFLRDNEIEALQVIKTAFVLSPNEIYKNRFNQISGDTLIMYFDKGDVSRVEVKGNVYNVYYMYTDEQKPNGLTQSSAESAALSFRKNKISEVRLYGSPKSEYFPENMVKGKEQTFALPRFNIVRNRPTKSDLLKQIKSAGRIFSPMDTLQ